MKTAFIAYTPFHILNVLSHVYTYGIKDADLYVICMFKPYEDMMQKIRDLGLFSNVYVTDVDRLQKNEKLWSFYGVVDPQTMVKHLFGQKGVKSKNYTDIYFSYPTRFIDDFINMYKDAHVYAYDDGLGSYIGDVFRKDLGRKYEMVKSVMGVKDRYPECVYLNNAKFSITERECPTKPLKARDLTSEEQKNINSVFGFNETDDYQKYRFIYLNRPHSDSKDAESYINDERRILNELPKDKTIIRLHPRETDLSFYEGFAFDENKGWELLCMNCLTVSNVLISGYSTAQFTPKMFYDKEPYVVFIYKLIDDLCVDAEMERMIDRLRDSYRDPGKIVVPATLEDLRDVMGKFGEG